MQTPDRPNLETQSDWIINENPNLDPDKLIAIQAKNILQNIDPNTKIERISPLALSISKATNVKISELKW